MITTWTDAISQCISKLSKSDEFLGLGLAIPGPFDYEKGIGLCENSNQKFVNLKNINIKEALSKSLALPENKIKFIKNATFFSLGCYWFGMGRGSKKNGCHHLRDRILIIIHL